jgi:hypothetical protein
MLFLILLIILFIVSVIILSTGESYEILRNAALITAAVCVVLLIAIPTARFSSMCRMQEIKSLERTIVISRDQAGEIERAALSIEIAKANAFIDKAKFFNKNFFLDILIPDECCEIDYLK